MEHLAYIQLMLLYRRMDYLNIILWTHGSDVLHFSSIYCKQSQIHTMVVGYYWPVDYIVRVIAEICCWPLDTNLHSKLICQKFSGGTIPHYLHSRNSFVVSNLIHRLFLAIPSISFRRQNLIVQMQDNHRLDICNERNHWLNGE